jgi:hypothetical protein
VITASVLGPDAGDYEFTSSLPLAVLRLLAPGIAERAATPEPVLTASAATADSLAR